MFLLIKTPRRFDQANKNAISLYLLCVFLVGLLEVHNNTVKLEDVRHELDFVDKGGQWKPNCKPRKKVQVMIFLIKDLSIDYSVVI